MMDIRKIEIVSEDNPQEKIENKTGGSWNVIVELLRTAAYILMIAFLTRYFLVQPFVVEGSSMEPNFIDQEYLLVSKVAYRVSEVKHGDVIIFRPVSDPYVNYIKRVIGLPRELVEIKDGLVWIDGQRLEERYLSSDIRTWLGNNKKKTFRQKLDYDEYFVLGDNREFSKDSREIGPIPKANIVGPTWVTIFPFEKLGIVKH